MLNGCLASQRVKCLCSSFKGSVLDIITEHVKSPNLKERHGARERERTASSPAASCVIKIKAVVMGYSFWPLTVGIHLTGSASEEEKRLEPGGGVEIKVRGGVDVG